MDTTDDPRRIPLHDDAYRYAYRRSRSTRLAADVALEAVDAVEDARTPGSDAGDGPPRGGDTERILLVTTARAALERFLPPSLPPRVEGDRGLQATLAALSPGDREFLLLHHWDGLGAEAAARASGQDPGRLAAVESMCMGAPGTPAGSAALAAALSAADPARDLTEEDLGRSRRALGTSTPTGAAPPNPTGAAPPSGTSDPAPEPVRTVPATQPGPPPGAGGPRSRRIQTVIGAVGLLVIAVTLAVLLPRQVPGPTSETARLYELADVVAVVAASTIQPTMIDGEVRILRGASVVQIVKGESAGRILTVDVTGRSTLERPYSRNLYPPDQLMFLVHGEHGVLTPIEGEGSVLTLVDRRNPEATTTTGDPAPLPDELRDAIRAMPPGELTLDTSGKPPGALDPASIVGIRPAAGRDTQNLPEHLLGTFRMGVEGTRACVMFAYNGRLVLLRWPDGFSAYERERTGTSARSIPLVDRRVLTVLNERGYPYVDDDRSTPFIRGVPTGGRGECGGQELEVWDIAVAPGSTLLFY